MNSKHVPKRRFSGFDGEWKEIKLYEVVQDFIVPMRDKPKEFSGNIPWTRIDDIEGKYISRSLKGHCVSLETVKSMNLKIIPEDSLIVSASATFGTVAIVKNDLITNQTFIGLVPKNKYEVEFLFYLFQSPKVRNYMKEESAGSTIFYISRESFEKMEIDLPDEKERKLLIKQLCTIDSLITIHQHKLDKLKNLKKAYLSEMFPAEGERVPKRRFPGFEGEWEEKKLFELADVEGGGTPSTVNPQFWDGDIDWYTPAEIDERVFVDRSKRKITNLALAKSSAKMLPIGTVLFTSRAGIGKTAILAREGCTNQGFQSIIPKEGLLDSYFIYSLSNKLKSYGERIGAGSTFVEVSGKQMSEMSLIIPSIFEQKQIGNFFNKLDQSISLQQQKLDKLNDLKKAYLNELFV